MVVQELVALLGVKTDKPSITKAQGNLNNLAGLAKVAAGAFMALGAVKWVKGAIDQVMAVGQETGKLAARVGVSTDLMQRLGYAAKLSGSDIEGLAAGLQKMQIQQVAAANGSAGAAEKFKRFGVEIKNADGTMKNSGQLMLEMADGIGGLKSDAEKTAAVIGVFGRAAGPLVGMFKKGSKGILEMSGELEEFGAIMDEKTIASTREYAKQNKRLNAAMLGIKVTVAKSLIPILTKGRKAFMDWYAANGKVIRQNIEKIFKKLGTVLDRVSRLLGKTVENSAKFLFNLNPMSKKILGVTTAVLGLMKVLKMGWMGKWIILLAIAVLLLEDLQVFLEGGDSALGRFFKKIEDITGIDFAKWTRDAADALSILAADPYPFDWGMYFDEVQKVLREHMDAANQTWKNWLGAEVYGAAEIFASGVDNTLGLAFLFVKGIIDAFGAIAAFLVNVWYGPREAWYKFMQDFTNASTEFKNMILTVFEPIINWLSDWAERAIDAIVEPFKNSPSLNWIIDRVSKLFGDGAGGVPLKGLKNGIAGTTTTGGSLAGSGGLSTVTSGNSIFNAPTNITIDIKATPGMNEKKLATEASRQMGSEIDRRNRKTMQALHPQKAGV